MFDFTKPMTDNDTTIWDTQEKAANEVMKPTRSASYKAGTFMFWFFFIFFIGGIAVIWTDGFKDVLFYAVEHDEVVIIQSMDGGLEVDNATGIHFKGFGKVTRYPRTMVIGDTGISGDPDMGEPVNVTFADGETVGINAVTVIELPTDTESLLNVHRKFAGNTKNIERCVEVMQINALKQTALTMTSGEVLASRKHEFAKMFSLQMLFGLAKLERYNSRTEDGRPYIGARILLDKNGIPIPAGDDYPITDIMGIRINNSYVLGYTFGSDFTKRMQERQQAELSMLDAEAKLEILKAERKALIIMQEAVQDAMRETPTYYDIKFNEGGTAPINSEIELAGEITED